MLQTNRKTTKGDCETCERTDVELTQMHHNMMMCPTCVQEEKEAIERTKHAVAVVTDARKNDAAIELKQDLFNAGTVAFVEIEAAILNNSEIPAEKKNFAVMSEVADRIQKLDAVIFERDAATLALKNERHALLVNAQNVAARLHEKEREQFKQYDVNYKPQVPKSTKPKVVKTTAKKFDKAALYAAVKKYGVEKYVSQVQGMVTAQGITYEAAAQKLAEQLGLI